MKFLLDILRGLAIGVANIIPGVSGGTLAVSMGIYDKIILSITGLFRETKKSIQTILPYGIGMVLGILGLSFLIEFLFDRFPLPTILFFIGLILGGVPAIFRRIKGKKVGILGILLFVIFFLLLLFLPIITGSEREGLVLIPDAKTILLLFLIGIIASATMVIPGVSGSMILMSLGFYAPVLSSVNGFVRAGISFHISDALAECIFLVPFGLGVLAGIVGIAKLISFFLKRFEALLYCAVLGLVLASPFSIFLSFEVSFPGIPLLLVSVLALLGGFFGAYSLAKKE